MNRLHTAAAKSRSARFSLYTPCTRSYTDTHKSDIHEIIFFEASVELNDNEILSTCFYVYYAKLLYLSHLPAPPVYFFLIYQIQFLFHCVIVAAKPKIFSAKFRSLSFQQNPESHLFYSVFQPPHPWWTAANKRCKWHYIESSLFKTSFGLHPFDDPVMDTFGFFPHGKKLFLFLKHQSSLNKTTVLSQESNNNFLYIWQTGFCIFFSHPILRSQVNFISSNLSLCGFVCVSFSSQNRSAVFPMAVHFVLTIQIRW